MRNYNGMYEKSVGIPMDMGSVTILTTEDVLLGYSRSNTLYPRIPSLSHWRAWECAAYGRMRLAGRVLDVGCGDGRYFELVWPGVTGVVGVELDPGVADAGMRSGVYSHIHVASAESIPEADGGFDSAFANCSLEHMDNIERVLAEINRCLKPGGALICSVVTDRFVDWNMLPAVLARTGAEELSARLLDEFASFHHLRNPLRAEAWMALFKEAGFELVSYIPLLPRINSTIFLALDSLWHLKDLETGGEMGDSLHAYLQQSAEFPAAFGKVIESLMAMEQDPLDCSGAAFHWVKAGGES